MTWAEFSAARLLLSEERLGSRVRAVVRAEDAAIAATKEALRKQ